MSGHVFISHSSKDSAVAELVCRHLENAGLRCWLAQRDVSASAVYAAAILEGIERSRAMVVVWSAHANESPHVLREVERAVSRNLRIVPFRIGQVTASKAMEYLLSAVHWVTAQGVPTEAHLARLVAALQDAPPSSSAPPQLSAPPQPSAPPIPSAPPTSTRRGLREGLIELPVSAVSLALGPAEDAVAFVGGYQGELLAIDLRSGDVVHTVQAAEVEHGLSPEVSFLEVGSDGDLITLSSGGVLKRWRFDGAFRQVFSVPLLTEHAEALKLKLSSEEPPRIIGSSLTPDRSNVLCLTDWGAMFRCDLKGRLRGPVQVKPGARAMVAANDDGSAFFVGRSDSYDAALSRWSSEGPGPGRRAHPNVEILNAWPGGRVMVNADVYGPDLEPLVGNHTDRRTIPLSSAGRVRAYPAAGLVLVPFNDRVTLYDPQTLEPVGDPLVVGHPAGKRIVDARLLDEHHAVTAAETTLRIWALRTRRPLGAVDEEGVFHHRRAYWPGFFQTATGVILSPDNPDLVTISEDGCEVVPLGKDTKMVGAGGVPGSAEPHLLSLDLRDADPPAPQGFFDRVRTGFAEPEPPSRVFVLKQWRLGGGGLVPIGQADLASRHSTLGSILFGFSPNSEKADSVDLGGGRVAVLIGGHLLIYDLRVMRIVTGPIDVFDLGFGTDRGTFNRLEASPDRTRLFVTCAGKGVAVHHATSLEQIALLPASMFPGEETYFNRPTLLPISSHQLLFTDRQKRLCIMNVEHPASARLVGSGRAIATNTHQQLWLGGPEGVAVLDDFVLSLATGVATRLQGASQVAGVFALPRADPSREEKFITVSYNGTAKVWRLAEVLSGLRA